MTNPSTLIQRPDNLPSYTYKVKTPDGTMFATIVEHDGQPYEVHVMIGKTGTLTRAWTNALEGLASLALRSGIPLIQVIQEVSGITTEKVRSSEDGINIRSGPEGLAYALLRYLQEKRRESGYVESEGTMEFGDFDES